MPDPEFIYTRRNCIFWFWKRVVMINLSGGLALLLLCAILSTTGNVYGMNRGKEIMEPLASLEAQAVAGSDKAQMKLGVMYLQGRGVAPDIDKALFYYRMAAEREIAFAQLKLAGIYLQGRHVEREPEKALKWLLRSARQGFVPAQLELSRLYQSGTFVDRDMVKAHQWISIASSLTDMNLEQRQQELEVKMTFAEIVYARLQSRICILNGYEDC